LQSYCPEGETPSHLYYNCRMRWPLLLLLLFLSVPAWTQTHSVVTDSTVVEDKNNFLALPVLFFRPETRWGFGVAGLYAFHLGKQTAISRPSQVQMVFAYTQNNQIIWYAPFKLFSGDRKYTVYGEVGIYRFSYFFYGVGNDVDPDFDESFQVTFPRFRVTALRKFRTNWFVGPRFWFQDYQVTEQAKDGLLEGGTIPGADGGLSSGPGIVMQFDSRDNVFCPSKGSFVEAFAHYHGPEFASDFDFTRYQIDARKYIANKRGDVLAFNAYGEFVVGHPPFHEMALMGGGSRMRGYYKGRYRDRNMAVLQTELRSPLFWKLGAVAFVSSGVVEKYPGRFEWDHVRTTAGAGLRVMVYPKKKINLRLDAAFGKNTRGFYLTVGESF